MRYTHHTPQEHIVVHFRYDWMNQIWEKKGAFLAVFMLIAGATYGALYALDFYPEMNTQSGETVSEWVTGSRDEDAATTTVVALSGGTTGTNPEPQPTETVTKPVTADTALPVRVIIEKLNRDVKVLNPQDTSVAALDAALLQGVVRHPDSADFKNVGTMFLLGHSSYLPTVRNKNFQAFNGLDKLAWGDVIRIQSADTEYLYRVQKVYEAKASNAEADIQWSKAELIMVTCNSFGTKDDRFVVEGYLVKSYPIPS